MFYYDSFTPESITGTELDQLLAYGWYRMHQSLFTTSHVDLGDVYRVHWLRYPLADLFIHRSHQRLRAKNKSFKVTITDANNVPTEHMLLHARYRSSITFDGALSIQESLFGDREAGKSIFKTQCISIYDGETLIAAGYFDTGQVAAASILHFYDPRYKRFSLGRYLILRTIDYLHEQGFTYYYPGYVIGGLPKMNYKLFLGREFSQYFDPRSSDWKAFDERILIKEPEDIPPIVANQSPGAETPNN